MSQFITANGVNTTLATAITSTATVISLSSLANLPTLQTGQMIPLILRSASAVGVFEIVYGTAISGASITVTRSMEGTSAQNFNVGDYVLCGPTAGSNALIRAVMNPATSQTLPQAYGAAVIPSGLSAAITLTLPNAVPAGTSYTIYGDGSYAVTVNVSVTSGSPSIGLPDGSYVFSWVIPVSGGYQQGLHIVFDGTNWRAQSFGQTVVAPATQSNAATQLSQLFIGNRKAVFTANGSYTVPNYVSTIWVSASAAGGGGGGGVEVSSSKQGPGGGGGYPGQSVLKKAISVTPGATLSIVIGAGGVEGGGSNGGSATNGNTGGDTTLSDGSTTLLSLTGGSFGSGATLVTGTTFIGGPGFNSGFLQMSYDGSGFTTSAVTGQGGSGGPSLFGGAGSAGTGYTNATAGVNGGGGGGGGGGASSFTGGAGGNGILIIEW